jgi:hypothetical protein
MHLRQTVQEQGRNLGVLSFSSKSSAQLGQVIKTSPCFNSDIAITGFSLKELSGNTVMRK